MDIGFDWAIEIETSESEDDLSPELQKFLAKPYFIKSKPKKVINQVDIDGNLKNSDWTKGRYWDLPTTLDGLLSVIGFTSDSVEEFLTLPASKAMPKDLRLEVYEYLRELAKLSKQPD